MRRTEMPRLAPFTCTECGARFARRKDRASRSTDGVIRCTPCSRSKHVPQVDNSGPRNGQYKHGRRVGKNITKRAVRLAVAERDGDWCILTGKPGPGLHLHRVLYGSEGGEYAVDNCVQLSSEAHALVHSSKRTWQPLLVAHLAGDRKALAKLRALA